MPSKKQQRRESEILMHLAIQNQRVEEVAQRLRDGADPNAFDDRSILTGTPYAFTALCAAIAAAAHTLSPERATIAEVNRELSQDSPPHDILGERARSIEIIRLLLSAGADPNLSTRTRTPLAVAALSGDAELVALLLDAGADVAGPSWSPLSMQPHPKGSFGFAGHALHEAAQKGHTEVVRLLCARGADVSARDHEGKTASELAIERGHSEIVQILQSHE